MRSMTKIGAVAALATTALFGATAANAAVISDPAGKLLDTRVITIDDNPTELDMNNSAGWVASGNLNNDTLCGLNNQSGNLFSYKSVDLNITAAGTFAFRIVDTTGDGQISSDPFLAVFKDFDPTDIDAGVVGCNDDANDWSSWTNDDVIPGYEDAGFNDLYSWFSADLQPGHYTLLLTTYDPVASADWQGPQSATFQFWGPNCSIEGLACDLAETGVDATPSLVGGIGLLVAGIVAVVVRRRRA